MEGHYVGKYDKVEGQYHGDHTSTSDKVFHPPKNWMLDEWQDIFQDKPKNTVRLNIH